MIPTEDIIHVIEKLIHRTQESEVRWQSMRQYDGPCYYVAFPGADLQVLRSSRHSDPAYISITLVTTSGDEIGNLLVHENETHWDLASTLWKEAARCATGWDKVLKTIKKTLKKSGLIGEERRPSREDDDAIPF